MCLFYDLWHQLRHSDLMFQWKINKLWVRMWKQSTLNLFQLKVPVCKKSRFFCLMCRSDLWADPSYSAGMWRAASETHKYTLLLIMKFLLLFLTDQKQSRLFLSCETTVESNQSVVQTQQVPINNPADLLLLCFTHQVLQNTDPPDELQRVGPAAVSSS